MWPPSARKASACACSTTGSRSARRRSPILSSTTPSPLTIGYEAWGGPNSSPRESGNFVGLIDEVKIWSRALSGDEIRREYEALQQQAANDASRRQKEKQERERQRKAVESGEMIATAGIPWRLVATDEFTSPALSPQWQSLRGKWRIKNGMLTCSEVSFLGTAKVLKPPVRVEFRARSTQPSDLSAFVGSRSETYRNGYFIGFASNGNSKCKLLRLGEEIAQSDKTKAIPGQWHHVIAQILPDGRIQLLVDGKTALDHRDPKPLRTAETAGILAWGPADFDWLRIYTAER